MSSEDNFSLFWSRNWAEDGLSTVQPFWCLLSSKEHQEMLQCLPDTQKIEAILEANTREAFDCSQKHLQCCLDFLHCVLICYALKLSPPLVTHIFCSQASLHTCSIALLLAESQLNKLNHCKMSQKLLRKCTALLCAHKTVLMLVWSLKCGLLTYSQKSISHRPHTFRVRAAYSLWL